MAGKSQKPGGIKLSNPFKAVGRRLGGFLISGAYLGGKKVSSGAKRVKAKK